MKDSVEHPDQRYAFFLGAGCSITSGIPSAAKLVRNADSHSDWLRRLRDVRSSDTPDHKIDEWARKELSAWNPDNPAGSYGEIVEKLFLTPGDRQREIERICDTGHDRDEKQSSKKPFPNFGYAVLSSLMCQQDGRFNVALTTNFDDLLTDAFFYFQEVRPLVIHHDSLAPFIRPTYTRPLVVKVHGDHRLTPRNTLLETSSLNHVVAQRVSTVLHDRGIVFLGYGGNDESIISMMEKLPDEAIPFGIYWVSGSKPYGLFRSWLESRGALWVENSDFDELMFRMSQSFDISDPERDRHDRVLSRYQRTKWSMLFEIAERPAKSIEDAKQKAQLASIIAQNDPAGAEKLFEEAIQQFPESSTLLNKYAIFLTEVRNETARAEAIFKRGVEANPKDCFILSSYAFFLLSKRKDLKNAEVFYKRAVEAAPTNSRILSRYAEFLDLDGAKLDEAEHYYKRAVEADPKNTSNLTSYARFLRDKRKNLDGAEDQYKRAVDANPKNSFCLVRYAAFLGEFRKDLDRAEAIYKIAIEVDSEDSDTLVKYATFLAYDRKNIVQAEEQYRRAIEVDPNDAYALGSFAVFLVLCKNMLDEAQHYFRRAIDANPKDFKNKYNLGVLHLIGGSKESGFVLLEEAMTSRSDPKDDAYVIGASFHYFLHGDKKQHRQRLREIKELVLRGVRADGWTFDQNVERAVKENHAEKKWLSKLASVITESKKPTVLSKWLLWKGIKVAV